MALGWPSVGLKELESGQIRAGFLNRIETAPEIRIWASAGPLTIPADAIETDAANLYQGVGELLNVPALSQLVNGLAERIDMQFSGAAVTSQVAELARSEASLIRNKSFFLGFLIFDKDWQILSPVAWLWEGLCDSLGDLWDGSSGEVSRVVSLSVGSIMTGRQRPYISLFTDASQKTRSPTDTFFSEVSKYNAGSTKVWPV